MSRSWPRAVSMLTGIARRLGSAFRRPRTENPSSAGIIGSWAR